MGRRPAAPEGSATEAAILDNLRHGATRQAAFSAGGIARTTFYRMLDRNTFRDAVEKAESEAEVTRVRRIEDAGAKGNWQADAWWLERRRPNDYARREKVDMQVDVRSAVKRLTDSPEEQQAAIEEVERILSGGS